MSALARNIKRLREERGLTQVGLGRLCGLTQPQISLYESGSDVPEVGQLLKLARGLLVTMETLVEGVDEQFDAVYQGLRAGITVEPGDDVPPREMSMGEMFPGSPAVADHGESSEALASPETVNAIDRVMAELATLRGRLVPGPDPVDGTERARGSEGTIRSRLGGREKTRKKTPTKRPPTEDRKQRQG